MGQSSMSQKCVFCAPEIDDHILLEHGSMFLLEDAFPVSPGHSLVIPRRHVADYFALYAEEKEDADHLLRLARQRILERDATVKGFNVGVNCGVVAGQTIFHVHIHLIPRREGDTPNPRGGVRGVIPARMNY